MSDQDNLRDRIGDLLENMDGFDFSDVAQTIIDDLGLKVEVPKCNWRLRMHSINCDCYSTPAAKYSRVLGKWEKQ